MFSVLKKWTAAGVAAAALAVTFGLATVADNAEARPAFAKMGDIKGEATDGSQASQKRIAREKRQRRVSIAQMRRILRKAKRTNSQGARLAQKRPTPPPPGAPGSYSTGSRGGGGLNGGVSCAGFGLCFCDGAAHCNAFIALCVELEGRLSCTDHDSEGRPTSCSCYVE